MRQGEAGFTLIELMIVIAIVGVLAAIAIPQYQQFRERGYIAQAQADLKQLANALTLLANDTDTWPGGNTPYISPQSLSPPQNGEEYEDLTASDMGLFNNNGTVFAANGWNGPYLPSGMLDANGKFTDPWGKSYFIDYDYRINGTDYVCIGSYGPNKGSKNAYDSDDIYVIVGY